MRRCPCPSTRRWLAPGHAVALSRLSSIAITQSSVEWMNSAGGVGTARNAAPRSHARRRQLHRTAVSASLLCPRHPARRLRQSCVHNFHSKRGRRSAPHAAQPIRRIAPRSVSPPPLSVRPPRTANPKPRAVRVPTEESTNTVLPKRRAPASPLPTPCNRL